jgi:hypothetical protein
MENELKFNNQKDRVDFDHINEYAKRFRLSVEYDAFSDGLRLGFQLASENYLEYLSEFEKRRANNIIVINTNESNLLDKINV